MKRNHKHKRRRGISFGTILMLVLTIVIGGGCLTLLPRLQGNTEPQQPFSCDNCFACSYL